MVNVGGSLIDEEEFKQTNGLKSIPAGKTKYVNRRTFTDELVMLITEGDGTKHVIKTLVGIGQEITELSDFNFEILIRDDQEQDLE